MIKLNGIFDNCLKKILIHLLSTKFGFENVDLLDSKQDLGSSTLFLFLFSQNLLDKCQIIYNLRTKTSLEYITDNVNQGSLPLYCPIMYCFDLQKVKWIEKQTKTKLDYNYIYGKQ